jgi:alpha-beta hydrolase superfamily lysophospholipase
MARTVSFTASDGKHISYYSWIPRGDIVGVIQIVHGMAEHALRYDHFATKLRTKGYAVYASDLRGHGKTIEAPDEQGFFADTNGWFRTVEDILELTEIIKVDNPEKDLFLIGHSMGSFLARTLMIDHGDQYQGVILSGTASHPGLTGYLGKIIASFAAKKDGGRVPNKRLNDMSFGSYNKAFMPNRTEFDWLSRDEEQVDLYVKDPLCGFICTSKLYEDLLTGLLYVNDPKKVRKIPGDLATLIISGSMDPVGDKGTGVRKVYELLKAAPLKDVSMNLYDEARHEIFNETNRNEVENFCIAWIEDHRR